MTRIMSEMITRTYIKPFHSVELHYLKGKRETDFEKELVKRYHSFIDRMDQMHQRIKPLRKRFYHEQYIIEQHDVETKNYKQCYSTIKDTVERFMTGTKIEINEFHELKDHFSKETERYLEYHREKVDPWREMKDITEAEFIKLHNWFDKEGADKAYDYFNDYGQELYKNHNNYTLDLCQYDEDVDNMNGKRDKVDKQWYDLFDLREKTIVMEIPVCARLEKINELVRGIERDVVEMDESRLMFNN